MLDSTLRELTFKDNLVKRFRQPATNAFDEQGWLEVIDDPLPGIAGRKPMSQHSPIEDLITRVHQELLSPEAGEVLSPAQREAIIEKWQEVNRLLKPSEEATSETAETSSRKDEDYRSRLDDPSINLNQLMSICHEAGKDRPIWQRTPQLRCRLADLLLDFGEPIKAYDVLTEPLREKNETTKTPPESVRVRQLRGLALARSGANGLANEVLRQLNDEVPNDPETLGILARTERALSERPAAHHVKQGHLKRAMELYERAHQLGREKGAGWTAISAAITAVLLRNMSKAKELARQARAESEEQLRQIVQVGGSTYWPQANLGLCAMFLEEWNEAKNHLSLAAEAGKGRYGLLASTRTSLRLVAPYLGDRVKELEATLPLPSVVLFVGHMIDKPGDSRRFPPDIEPKVKQEIQDRLTKLNARIGFSSAACGADILFLEALQGQKESETHIVLPYDRKLFLDHSVRNGVDGERWEARFEGVTRDATSVVTAAPQRLGKRGVSFQYSNLVVHGLALIKARQLDTELKYLAVYNEKPGRGDGGTADTVARWRKRQKVEVINSQLILELAGSANRAAAPAPIPPAQQTIESDTIEAQIAYIFFADVANFSKLREDQIRPFVDKFLGLVRELIDKFQQSASAAPEQPLAPGEKKPLQSPFWKVATWGDGLYFVFDSVRAAGTFALELSERVKTTQWVAQNLPPDLNIRIGLHAGPVIVCTDPVTRELNYMGTHVSHGARIEPITPNGDVYASSEFAACAEADGVQEFSCHYVGQREYAKKYGIFPIYRLERVGHPD